MPITLFRGTHLKALEKVPLLIHVYGSYGKDLVMEFCPKKRLLLDLGWALAYCHIRYRLKSFNFFLFSLLFVVIHVLIGIE